MEKVLDKLIHEQQSKEQEYKSTNVVLRYCKNCGATTMHTFNTDQKYWCPSCGKVLKTYDNR